MPRPKTMTKEEAAENENSGFGRFLSRLTDQGSKVGYGGKAGSYLESGEKKKARYDKMTGIKK